MKSEMLARFFERTDRRTFLKAAGALGVGAVAGGALQAAFRLLDTGGDAPLVSRMRVAMGTFVEVNAAGVPRDLADEAIDKAFDEMDRLAAILSRHDPSTPLSHLNAHGSLSGPPPELTAVMLHALDVNRRTGGVFDPTVKPLIDLLEAPHAGEPDEAAVREATALVGAGHVHFADRAVSFDRSGVEVTLDGVAKGYIVDRMSDVMTAAGVGNHLINAGGDIRSRGERTPGRAWTVAIEDPKKKGNYPDVIRMRDGAVATSGSYERFYDPSRRWHHIIDPATGHSPHRCVSVSVRAATVMEADALSTAVFVMGQSRGLREIDAEHGTSCFIVDSTGNHRSSGWS